MQEVCPLGLAQGTHGQADPEEEGGCLHLPMVVVLQPGGHPHAHCQHGDTCKDKTRAGMWHHHRALGTFLPSLVPPNLCQSQA